MVNKAKLTKVLVLAGVFIVLAIVYLPIITIVVFSFTESGVLGQWDGFSLALYRELFNDTRIWTALRNTLVIASVAAAISTIVGTVSAIGIHYMKRKSKRSFLTTNRAMIIMPAVVMAIALRLFFLATGLRPMGFVTLIIAHTMVTIPFVIMTVMPRLAHLNPSVYDASQDLGAGHFRTLFTVILPQLIPAMIAGFAIAFTLSIDEFVISVFNNGAGITVETLSIFLYNQVARRGIPPVVRALSSVIFIGSFIILMAINIVRVRHAKKHKRKFSITSLAR